MKSITTLILRFSPLSMRERVRVRGAEVDYAALSPPHPAFGHLLRI